MKKKNILGKFTIVAAMIGFFSPSVSVQTNVQLANNSYSVSPIQLNISLFNTAEARRGGGRGGASRGGGARRSSGANRSGDNRNRSANRNRNKNVNRNKNRNVNRNVNVNVNHRYYGGHRHYGGYYGGRPILVFATGMVIGSIIAASTMPTTCTTIVTGGISYRQCGSSYYQPFYQGDTLVYKAVASPY